MLTAVGNRPLRKVKAHKNKVSKRSSHCPPQIRLWLRSPTMCAMWGQVHEGVQSPSQIYFFYRKWWESINSVKGYPGSLVPSKSGFSTLPEFTNHKGISANWQSFFFQYYQFFPLNNNAQSIISTISYIELTVKKYMCTGL